MIIEPFPDVFGMRDYQYEQCYEESCNREPMRTMKEGVVEVTRFTDNPEKPEESYAHDQKAYIIETRMMGDCLLFSIYETSCHHDSDEKMETKNKWIVCRKPVIDNSI